MPPKSEKAIALTSTGPPIPPKRTSVVVFASQTEQDAFPPGFSTQLAFRWDTNQWFKASGSTWILIGSISGDAKDSVRVATTGSIAALSTIQTIDGITLQAGDRILVKNQTDATQNGIWIVQQAAWNRAPDAATDDDVTSGMYVVVTEGFTNADTAWVLTTGDPIVLGTTPLTFSEFASVVPAPVLPTRAGNATPVTANVSASTSQQNLQALSLPPNALNLLNGCWHLEGSGIINARTSASATIQINIGTQFLISWSFPITATNLNTEFNYSVTIGCNTTGTAGKVYCHGKIYYKSTAGAGTPTFFSEGNTATFTVNLTIAQTLQTSIQFSANNGSSANNDATQHLMALV